MVGKLIFRQNISTPDSVDYFSNQWRNYSKCQSSHTFTDLVLAPDTGKVEVHMAVLMSLSPHLTNMMAESLAWWRELPIIILPEIKLVTVKLMLDLLYSGTCAIISTEQQKDVENLMTSLGLVIPTDSMVVDLVMPINTNIENDILLDGGDREETDLGDGEETDLHNEEERSDYIKTSGENLNNSSIINRIKKDIHQNVHHCRICGKKFNTNYLLSRHLISHSEDRPYSCNSCHQTFKQSHHLTQHLKVKHKICLKKEKKGLSQSGSIKKDDLRSRSVPKRNIKCDLCDHLASGTVKFKYHMKIQHKGIITPNKGRKTKTRGKRSKKLLIPPVGQETSGSVTVKLNKSTKKAKTRDKQLKKLVLTTNISKSSGSVSDEYVQEEVNNNETGETIEDVEEYIQSGEMTCIDSIFCESVRVDCDPEHGRDKLMREVAL